MEDVMAFIDRIIGPKFYGKALALFGIAFRYSTETIANAHRIAPVSATELGYYLNGTQYAGIGAAGPKFDAISELTVGAGITLDGLQLKDGYVVALDNQGVKFGTGADIVGSWDGSRFNWTQLTANSEMRYGIDGAGIDQRWYGDTASVYALWDQSADSLIFSDNAKVVLGTGSDDTLVHDGTNTSWTHTTGNLVIDNQLVTGATYFDVGTDTNATKVGIRNNTGTALWFVAGSGVIVERSYKLVQQGAPTAKTVSATLTAAEIKARIITVNQAGGAASALQFPTGTDLDAGFPDAAAGDGFDFSVINTSTVDAEDASVTVNTGVTIVGSADIHAYSAAGSLNSSALFCLRKTGAATWVAYRMA